MFVANNICSWLETCYQLLYSWQTDNSAYIRYSVALELQVLGELAKLCLILQIISV